MPTCQAQSEPSSPWPRLLRRSTRSMSATWQPCATCSRRTSARPTSPHGWARLWIPTDVVEAFSAEVMSTPTWVQHCIDLATWTVDTGRFVGTAAGTSEWGTARRNAGLLLHDALNSATPQVFDTVIENGGEKRVLNVEATEAAKEKLLRIKDAFTAWIWTDPDRTDRLARIYNDRFNNLVPRHFDGRHLTLPGASNIIRLYDHQKRVIWRIIASGSSYMAHAVGSGKTFSIAAAVMEQRPARPGVQGDAGRARPLPRPS